MLHATLNSNGINRVIAITVDPAADPQKAADLARHLANVADTWGFHQQADNLRHFADNAADLAQPDPVGESGS